MRPGFKTSEFWQALVAQALALCALIGMVNSKDTEVLQDTIGKCITGIFALVANAFIVISYMRARFNLKVLAADAQPDDHDGPNPPAGPRLSIPLWIIAAAGLAVWLVGSAVQAQSILPWRNGVLQQLREQDQKIAQLQNQQPAPQQQAPQIIVVPSPQGQPPLQTFPIQGQPQQTFPIPGQPKQDLPIQGQPRQDFPIQGQPQQQLPIGGQPRQDFPIPGQPQPLPIMPPAALQPGPQTYSIQRALAKPIN